MHPDPGSAVPNNNMAFVQQYKVAQSTPHKCIIFVVIIGKCCKCIRCTLCYFVQPACCVCFKAIVARSNCSHLYGLRLAAASRQRRRILIFFNAGVRQCTRCFLCVREVRRRLSCCILMTMADDDALGQLLQVTWTINAKLSSPFIFWLIIYYSSSAWSIGSVARCSPIRCRRIFFSILCFVFPCHTAINAFSIRR